MRRIVDIGDALVVGAAHAKKRQKAGCGMAIRDDSRVLSRLRVAEGAAGQRYDAVGVVGVFVCAGIADDRQGVNAAKVVLSLVPRREVPEKLV